MSAVDVLKTPSGLLKIVEIVLSCVIVGVTQGVEYFLYQNEARAIFSGGVMLMSLVVTTLMLIVFLAGHAKEIQQAPFEMLFNIIMAIFMISAGGVIIKNALDIDDLAILVPAFSKGADAGKAAGSIAIINGLVYGIDSFFAKKNME